MRSESDSPEHHRQRSEFIRNLVQKSRAPKNVGNEASGVPNTIVQFWHDPKQLPEDVRECISSWSKWENCGFAHRVFDTAGAGEFISRSLGPIHAHAFTRCYHPAMQADYFRLCYLVVEGGYMSTRMMCASRAISRACSTAPDLRSSPSVTTSYLTR